MVISFLSIIRQIVIYALLTIFITTIFVLSIFLGQEILENIFGAAYWLSALFGSLAVALCFQPLQRLIVDTIDKIFFRKNYNLELALNMAIQRINAMASLEEMQTLISGLIIKEIKVEQARIFLFNQLTEKFQSNDFPINFDSDSPLISFLEKTQRLLSWKQARSQQGISQELKLQMKEIGASLVIPLIINKELVAFFSLSPKLSEKQFSQKEILFLTELANHSVLPLDRAQLISKMQERIKDLEQLNKMAIDRELKMVELKRALNEQQNNGPRNN